MSLREKVNQWESLCRSPVDEGVDVIHPRFFYPHTGPPPPRQRCVVNFYHLHPKGGTRNIRTLIEADKECTDARAVYWREKIYKDFANSIFSRSGMIWEEIEKNKHKRGEYFECMLQPIEGAQPKAVKRFRAVRIREQVLEHKIREFEAKGWK